MDPSGRSGVDRFSEYLVGLGITVKKHPKEWTKDESTTDILNTPHKEICLERNGCVNYNSIIRIKHLCLGYFISIPRRSNHLTSHSMHKNINNDASGARP